MQGQVETLTVYADNTDFAYGQDELELTALAFTHPVSVDFQQHLMNLMLVRAKVHGR